MKCLHPVQRSIDPNNPNLGSIFVPCQKCEACKLNSARDLAFRLDCETKAAVVTYFVTLTYAPEHLPLATCYNYSKDTGEIFSEFYLPNVDKDISKIFRSARSRIQSEIKTKYPLKRFGTLNKSSPEYQDRLFFNNLQKERRLTAYKENKFLKFKYYLISEYGPNNSRRSHYHFLMFYYTKLDILTVENFIKEYIWKDYGSIEISKVNDARINYIAGYLKKECPSYNEFQQKNICRSSRGIGDNLLQQDCIKRFIKKSDRIKNLRLSWRGKTILLPKHFKEKLKNQGLLNRYTPEELQQLHNDQLTELNETFGKAYEQFLIAYHLQDVQPFDHWKEFQQFQYKQENYLKNHNHGLNTRKDL